jgi:flavin reductase (DIM6/NTAB) family NADH-FMN oxidoreductase RutF
MELETKNFYKVLAPRTSVLITTIDLKGRVNAAPFSFIMPISMKPPLLTFACGHGKDTLLNTIETKEFVVNIPSKEILKELWICNEKFPIEVNELEKANLTEEKAKKVKPPRIKECFCWFECILRFQKELGDHILIVGEVVHVEIKDKAFLKPNGNLNLEKVKPLLHLGGKEFSIPDEEVLKVLDY